MRQERACLKGWLVTASANLDDELNPASLIVYRRR